MSEHVQAVKVPSSPNSKVIGNQERNDGNAGPFKRKRKSGFLSRYKKFGSQGKLGRGYEINSETYNYFLRIFELCNKNEFDTDEEKDLFIDNAFTQTENEEVHLSSNQFTSRVLEVLISLTKNDEILHRFTLSFTESLRTICMDPFASHVLEKLLEVISEKWMANKKLVKWFRSTSKYILNNYEDFVFDTYANHITRKVCQCLSRTIHLFSSKTQQHNASSNRLQLPSVITPIVSAEAEVDSVRKFHKRNIKILKEFAERFLNWPQFYDLFHNESTSGFVQCLLVALRSIDDELAIQGVTQVVKAINEDQILDFPCNLHSLEVCVSVCTEVPETFQLIYSKYFKEKLLTFIGHENGHFVVERLCLSTPNKEIFEEIFGELENNFQEIYDSKYLSVFTAMADGCKRLKCKQNIFMTKLSDLLATERESKKENFVEVMLRFGKNFQPKEDGTVSFMTELQGCLVIQHMLSFHKPYKVITGFLDMDGLKLSKLSQDPKGSYVMDAFFKSETVGEKNKEKLLLKLKEYFVAMACTKFGTRVLDNLFPLCSFKQKEIIVSSLAPRETQLNANAFGKFISSKYGLAAYKRNPSDWARAIEGEGTKKRKKTLNRFVSDLGLDLTDVSSTLPSKKSKKRDQDIL